MESLSKNLILLYNILFFILVVLGFPLIIPVVLVSDKRRGTFFQRMGFWSLPAARRCNRFHNTKKKAIWIHALSVGEVFSAEPLIKSLKNRFKDREIVVSVSTRTGFDIAYKQLRGTADTVFFYPYDLTFSVKYIASKIDPDLVVIVETDIWPNFLFEMKKRDVPVILANARLSKRSFVGYKRLGFFAKPLFFCFANICTQSMEDAKRFQALDVPSNRITVTGNVKFEQEFQPLPTTEIEKLRHSMHIQPQQKILLAGSTHKGEESILLDALARLKRRIKGLVLIVAPRDPRRAKSISRIFNSSGFSVAFLNEFDLAGYSAKAEGGRSKKRFDVIVVDIIGFLKKLYALADVAFVGGSLVNCGGHNPLEPAIFSKPILFGPDMSDFAHISNLLMESGGALRVQDAKSLYETAAMIMGDDNKASEMGNRALNVFLSNKGALEKTLKVVEACL